MIFKKDRLSLKKIVSFLH